MGSEDDVTSRGTAPHHRDPEGRLSILLYHPGGVEVVPLPRTRSLTIGRSGQAEVTIGDASLSRYHARFELIDEEVWVEDLGSTNGTRINGETVQRSRVRLDDEVTLGSISISLHATAPLQRQLPGVESYSRFQVALEEEVTRARTFGRKLAVLMVRQASREQGLLSRWCARVRQSLRAVDRIGLYGPDAVAILLPEVDLGRAVDAGGAIVRGGRLGEPQLLCGAAVFPEHGASAEELIEVSRTALQQATREQPLRAVGAGDRPESEPSSEVGGEEAVVCSEAMRELYRTVDKLAVSPIPVLIIGETGAGKELIARALHRRGPRKAKPLRCINCGAIPQQLIESALFGHEKGAFTGAERQAKGVFEEATGGTVLLDEVGELSASAQVALLRVLESKQICRVGSSREIAVDVRILAATHRDLEQMCQLGTFRWDLYYRLNAMTLKVPPLRERVGEIAPLAERFLEQANRANNSQLDRIHPRAMALLSRYPWPGNVRELRNVIERAVVVASGAEIGEADLGERLRGTTVLPDDGDARSRDARLQRLGTAEMARVEGPVDEREWHGADALDDPREEADFQARIRLYETALISKALHEHGWNQTRAAEALGIPRRTLVHKIGLYEIDRRTAIRDVTAVLGKDPTGDHAKFKQRVERYEATLLRDALRATGGDRRRAAQLLGLTERTLRYKTKKYEIA